MIYQCGEDIRAEKGEIIELNRPKILRNNKKVCLMIFILSRFYKKFYLFFKRFVIKKNKMNFI